MSDLAEENKRLRDRNKYLKDVIEGLRDNFRNMMVEVAELREQIKQQTKQG